MCKKADVKLKTVSFNFFSEGKYFATELFISTWKKKIIQRTKYDDLDVSEALELYSRF